MDEIESDMRDVVANGSGALGPQGVETPKVRLSVDQMIVRPPHYIASNGIEAINIIEGFSLNYRLGNVVKYVLRAGRKEDSDHLGDLKKARWYLNREIAAMEDDQ